MFDRFKEVFEPLRNLLRAKKRANASPQAPQRGHSPSQYKSPKWQRTRRL